MVSTEFFNISEKERHGGNSSRTPTTTHRYALLRCIKMCKVELSSDDFGAGIATLQGICSTPPPVILEYGETSTARATACGASRPLSSLQPTLKNYWKPRKTSPLRGLVHMMHRVRVSPSPRCGP